jgi:hypothetical protein
VRQHKERAFAPVAASEIGFMTHLSSAGHAPERRDRGPTPGFAAGA